MISDIEVSHRNSHDLEYDKEVEALELDSSDARAASFFSMSAGKLCSLSAWIFLFINFRWNPHTRFWYGCQGYIMSLVVRWSKKKPPQTIGRIFRKTLPIKNAILIPSSLTGQKLGTPKPWQKFT